VLGQHIAWPEADLRCGLCDGVEMARRGVGSGQRPGTLLPAAIISNKHMAANRNAAQHGFALSTLPKDRIYPLPNNGFGTRQRSIQISASNSTRKGRARYGVQAFCLLSAESRLLPEQSNGQLK
jgi:hypothetical protein